MKRYKPPPRIEPDYECDLKRIEPLELDDIYWDLREKLFGNKDELSQADRDLFVEKLGLAKHILDRRKREYGILYYKPYEALKIEPTGLTHDPRHAFRRVKDADGNNISSGVKPQELFHRSQAKVRMIIAGNQSGKTQSGAADDQWLALGIHPYINMETPNRGRIYGEKLDNIMEVIWPKYEAIMPIHEVRHISKYSGGQVKKVTYKNGSTDEFMSYEMPTKMSEGWTGHRVWFDEPPPKDVFTACVRGLMRYEGRIAITATPLSEAWIYDELFLKGKHIG